MAILTPRSLLTYYSTNHLKSSTLDLCFMSTNLKIASKIEIKDSALGSDHEPISISIAMKYTLNKRKGRPKWKFGDEKLWTTWRQRLPKLKPMANLDDAYNELKENLVNTSKEVFGQTSGEYNPKYNKPWWNKECADLVKLKLEAKKQLKRYPTTECLINYKRAEARVRGAVKAAKKNSFMEYYTSIKCFSPTLRKKIVITTEISITTTVFPIYLRTKYYTHSLQLFKTFRRNK